MFTLHCTKPGAGPLAAVMTAASASTAASVAQAVDAMCLATRRAWPWLVGQLALSAPAGPDGADSAADDSALVALLAGADAIGNPDDACAGCGWFDSSHALQHGLCVLEHASAEGLAGDLPLVDWLELQLAGWRPASPA